MKVRLHAYTHESNGLSIEIVPETDAEAVVLDAIWRFGRLETGYTDASTHTTKGFRVTAFKLAEDKPC